MPVPQRFALSLDLVDLDHQEPDRNRRESKYYWDELFRLVPATGFRAVEIPCQPKWDFGGRSGVPFTPYAIETKYGTADAFRKALAAGGIERVAGVVFSPAMFAGAPGDAYFGAFQHFGGMAVRFAASLGAEVLTISPTPPIGLLEHHRGDASAWEADFLAKTADVVGALAAQAAAAGVKVALKDEYWSLLRGERIDAFAERLGAAVSLDVDTAHAAIAGLDPTARIRALGARVGAVHLTDTSFADTASHWRAVRPELPAGRATQVFRDLGQGGVDLAAACRALDGVGYAGPVVVSCRQTRDVFRAMLRSRAHIDGVLAKA